jgi:hypothetical protein
MELRGIVHNLLIVYGAGASFDCVNEKHIEVIKEYKPPLVNQLFDRRFDYIIKDHVILRGAIGDLRAKLDKKPIEEILKEYEQIDDPIFKRIYYSIPLYFAQLFNEVLKYIPYNFPSIYDSILFKLKLSSFKEVCFLTPNYDNLLEKAFERVFDVKFDKPQVKDDYINIQSRYSIIKAHGSMNWGIPISGVRRGFTMNEVIKNVTTKLEFENYIYNKDSPRLGFNTNAILGYPCMAIPINGKEEFLCPEEHLTKLKKFIEGCNNIIFIGFSGNDNHIINLLRNIGKLEYFKIVNGDSNSGISALEKLKRISREFKRMDHEVIYSGGFVDYIENEFDKILI